MLEGWDIPGWALHAKPSMLKIYRISSDEFIIFKNKLNEIDWITSDEFDKKSSIELSEVDLFYSKITSLLSYLPKNTDPDFIENITIQCCHALAAIFNDNSIAAMEIMGSVENRISEYKYQKYMSISYKELHEIFILLITWIFFAYVIYIFLNDDFRLISLCVIAFCVGGVGSVASILSTKKEVSFKENLEDESVINDVKYKVLLGGIFASILYVMILSNIMEPFKNLKFDQSIVIFFLCGFSEKFAPSIFEKFYKN